MKKLIAVTIIIAALILESCEPAATFDKPQPDNVKSLPSFPERLQGKYLAADQTSIVTITDKLITRHYDLDIKEHKDSLIDLKNDKKEKILLRGDSVIKHENWTDTLFNISANNVLKKFKGYYFLNYRYKVNAWEVKELSLKKGVMTVGSISAKNDIPKLKKITETTADTISTHFVLSKRQFKTFVRQHGFDEQETFTRMTENGR